MHFYCNILAALPSNFNISYLLHNHIHSVIINTIHYRDIDMNDENPLANSSNLDPPGRISTARLRDFNQSMNLSIFPLNKVL